jgi:hypothetical protein
MPSSPVSTRISRGRYPVGLRHRIATLVLIMIVSERSFVSLKQAHSAEQSRVPNIVIILTDEKYGDAGRASEKSKEMRTNRLFCGFLELLRIE